MNVHINTIFHNRYSHRLYILVFIILAIPALANEYKTTKALEEVIVTAQKRQQALQSIPIAISVLNTNELEQMSISSLDGLIDGVIPSLRINPNGNAQSSLTVAIRGDGQSDVSQTTKQSPVAIYLDGIYLGRAQGLSMELADLQRIEVLRGPQGTLFGRNSTSGAISLISHKPTGEFSIKQTLSAGNYNSLHSVSRLNLAKMAGVSVKLDYLHSERDGWIKNKAPDQVDFNEYNNNAGRLSLSWQLNDKTTIDYTYDQSEIKHSNLYFQVYKNFSGVIEPEGNREKSTRFPIPLKPITVDLTGQSLIASFAATNHITIKSLTAYRELDEDGSNNLGGVFNLNGLIVDEDIEQEQFSQEIQFIGQHPTLEWATGLYYFKEDADFDLELQISLDNNFNVITPPVTIVPVTSVRSDAESMAIYGQGTLAINDQLHATIGARYTEDNKSAERALRPSPDINSEHTDATLALNYDWRQNVSTYIKWSTAYKAGGYNARSLTFLPYNEETNQTWELGVKSEWFNQRLRFNIAAFTNEYNDKQFDFIDPKDTLILETLNAKKNVTINGFETDLTAIALEGLTIGLHYTYLDGDMPTQPHPNESGETQKFELIQTPQHAGALIIDYKMPPLSIGKVSAHFDITATDQYAYSTTPDSRKDAYTLVNARLTLNDIPIGKNSGNLSLSVWGKNLTDEEYINLGYTIGAPVVSIVQSFGTPRMAEIEISYHY